MKRGIAMYAEVLGMLSAMCHTIQNFWEET